MSVIAESSPDLQNGSARNGNPETGEMFQSSGIVPQVVVSVEGKPRIAFLYQQIAASPEKISDHTF